MNLLTNLFNNDIFDLILHGLIPIFVFYFSYLYGLFHDFQMAGIMFATTLGIVVMLWGLLTYIENRRSRVVLNNYSSIDPQENVGRII